MSVPQDQVEQAPVEPTPTNETAWPEHISMNDSVAGQVSAQDVSMENSLVGAAVAGRNLKATNSLVPITVVGRDLHLQQSTGLVLVVGNQARATNSTIGLLIASSDVTLSESQVWMTTRQAAVFGAAAGLTFALALALRRLLRR